MSVFEDSLDTEFSFDSRYRWNEEEALWSTDERDAVALEDLLRLAQQRDEEYYTDTPAESHLVSIPFQSDEDALIWGLSIICESALGRSIAYDARFEDWSLEVDDIELGYPVIDPQLRILILPRGTASIHILSKSSHERFNFLINLARGLRMIWQDMNGIRTRIDLTADDQILAERLKSADRDSVTLRILWDLRGEGYLSLWRHVIAGDMGEVAVTASQFWDDRHYPVGMAQTCLSWLSCDHLMAESDNKTLDDMDARLQRSVADVCGIAMLTADDILDLSRLPDGSSYLAPLARTLCYNTEFRYIPDPVNEAHLKQILEEGSELMVPSLVFRDSDLEKKIFPNRIIDTLA